MQCTRPFVFRQGLSVMVLPCGKCPDCRVARQREWATRCVHELPFHHCSLFVTLTYDEDCLPENQSIQKSVAQKWIRRLKRYIHPGKVKYLLCGDYGDEGDRPHYHAIIFGMSVKDGFQENVIGRSVVYYHPTWPYGYIHIGAVTYASARYVIKYIQRKYLTIDWADRVPPFQLQSNGIGRKFCEANKQQIKDNLKILVNGKTVGVPRYYKKIIDFDSQALYEESKKNQQKIVDNYKKKGVVNKERVYNHCRKSRKQRERNTLAREHFGKLRK